MTKTVARACALFMILTPLVAAPVYAKDPKKTALPTVVLLPVILHGEQSKDAVASYQGAIAESLQSRYKVIVGSKVEEVMKKVTLKESQKENCDMTRCYGAIATEFNAEFVAVVDVTKAEGDYSVSLKVMDVVANELVMSKTDTCRSCKVIDVVEKLKLLAGVEGGGAAPSVAAAPAPSVRARDDNAGKAAGAGGALEKVLVESDPSGALAELVDGMGLGKVIASARTPGVLRAPAGQYELRVSAEGYRTKRFDVDIPSGGFVEITKEQARLAQMTGTVEVDTQPLARDAEVWIDGKKVGTVLKAITLSVGTYEVEARSGNKSGKKMVDIREGEALVLTIPFPGEKKVATPPLAPAQFAPTQATAAPSAGAVPEGMVYVLQPGIYEFYIDKTEVTQEAYERVIGKNPSKFIPYFKCPTCPVEQVNWDEADAYCKKVGKRLPREQEWEFAATSGGKGETYAGTSNEGELGDFAWYRENSDHKTHPVGEKKPNGLGLYDMSGNVDEWTDSWDDSKETRVLRGGSWDDGAFGLRIGYQRSYSSSPGWRNSSVGFRCAQ